MRESGPLEIGPSVCVHLSFLHQVPPSHPGPWGAAGAGGRGFGGLLAAASLASRYGSSIFVHRGSTPGIGVRGGTVKPCPPAHPAAAQLAVGSVCPGAPQGPAHLDAGQNRRDQGQGLISRAGQGRGSPPPEERGPLGLCLQRWTADPAPSPSRESGPLQASRAGAHEDSAHTEVHPFQPLQTRRRG